MLVSICVPVYKAENYIERCATSLFRQTYSEIEYIFVNDCTPDNSIDILYQTINKFPTRRKKIKIFKHEKNLGQAAARNTALNNCTGEFILWVDADDYIEIETIESLIKEQAKLNYDIVSFNAIVHYPKYNELWTQHKVRTPQEACIKIIERKEPGSLWLHLVRTNLYRSNNIFFKEGINMGEDYLVSILLHYYARNISYLDTPFYHYDRRNESAFTYYFSHEKGMQLWNVLNILESFFKDKATCYQISLQKAKIQIISMGLISCGKNPNKTKDYFKFIKTKLSQTNKKYWNTVSLPKQLSFYIKNIYILSIYIKLSGFINKYVKIFKNQHTIIDN